METVGGQKVCKITVPVMVQPRDPFVQIATSW